MIRQLWQQGTEAFGVEIDRAPIRESLAPDVAPCVDLTDGAFPLSFPDDRFASAVAIEVIEHLDDPGKAIAELRRVAMGRVFVTTPGFSSIPLASHLGVVPWHLLEATHVSFFTPRSLRKLLEEHYSKVRLFRINNLLLQGQFIPGSVAALCDP